MDFFETKPEKSFVHIHGRLKDLADTFLFFKSTFTQTVENSGTRQYKGYMKMLRIPAQVIWY